MSLLLLIPTSGGGPSPLGLNAPGAINLLLRGFRYAPVVPVIVNNTEDLGDVSSFIVSAEFGQGSQTFDAIIEFAASLNATAEFAQGAGTFDAVVEGGDAVEVSSIGGGGTNESFPVSGISSLNQLHRRLV